MWRLRAGENFSRLIAPDRGLLRTEPAVLGFLSEPLDALLRYVRCTHGHHLRGFHPTGALFARRMMSRMRDLNIIIAADCCAASSTRDTSAPSITLPQAHASKSSSILFSKP
jgi:hypothetical protein